MEQINNHRRFFLIRNWILAAIGLSAVVLVLIVSFPDDFLSRTVIFIPVIILLFGVILILSLLMIFQSQKKLGVMNVRLEEDIRIKLKQLQIANKNSEIANKKLGESEKHRREMIGMISHEIKTDLTPIKGYIDLLMEGKYGALSGKQKHIMGNINEVVDHQTDLLNKLIFLSKLEGGESALVFEEIDFSKLLKAAILNQKPLAKEKNIKLTVSIPKKLSKVRGSKVELKELVINLINNAIKYTPSKGKILVKAEKTNGKIITSVKDTGIGIPVGDFDKIFKKFYRGSTEFSKDVEGSGLGLSICKSIVETHKGKIWFESEKGLGTSFFFSIPVAKN